MAVSQSQLLFQSICKSVALGVQVAMDRDDVDVLTAAMDDARETMDFIGFSSITLREQLQAYV